MTPVEATLLTMLLVVVIFSLVQNDKIKDLENDNIYLNHNLKFYKNEIKKLQDALKEVG